MDPVSSAATDTIFSMVSVTVSVLCAMHGNPTRVHVHPVSLDTQFMDLDVYYHHK
jgi:hypothetical protein